MSGVHETRNTRLRKLMNYIKMQVWGMISILIDITFVIKCVGEKEAVFCRL